MYFEYLDPYIKIGIEDIVYKGSSNLSVETQDTIAEHHKEVGGENSS